MSRARGELPEPEEAILGIEHPSLEEEAEADRVIAEKAELRRAFLANLMQNDMFREWLMEQLVGFNTFGNPFGLTPTGFPQQEATQFHMGMKAAGWHLWTVFDDVAPEQAALMRREASKPR